MGRARDRIGTGARWTGRATVAGVAYAASLGLILATGPAPGWSVREVVFVYPLVGMVVGLVLAGAVHEVFVRVLPFVVDTLRFAARRLLPRRWGQPASAALTRLWAHTPGWMNRGVWMPDDEAEARTRSRKDDDA